jgi:hypothetical protein
MLKRLARNCVRTNVGEEKRKRRRLFPNGCTSSAYAHRAAAKPARNNHGPVAMSIHGSLDAGREIPNHRFV